MASHRFTADKLIEAISGTGGIITTIAQKLECDWHTAKTWIMKTPTAKQAWEDERNKIVDLAEQTVLKAMKEGDAGTARWVLGTLGKDRGWVERREVTGADGGAITLYSIVSPKDWDNAD